MIAALFKAIGQLPDPPFRRVVIGSFLLSVILFAALVFAASWLIDGIRYFDIGWLDSMIGWLGGIAAFVIGLILFPGMALTIVCIFLEPIVRAVEARHYPDLPPARGQPLGGSLLNAIRLAVITVVLNLVVLPLYFIPVVNLFVFYGLNGYLLGREYFELVALRRMGVTEARALRQSRKWRVLVGGIIITVLLSVPVINWMMPVIAAAFMVHVFEGIGFRKTDP